MSHIYVVVYEIHGDYTQLRNGTIRYEEEREICITSDQYDEVIMRRKTNPNYQDYQDDPIYILSEIPEGYEKDKFYFDEKCKSWIHALKKINKTE